MDRCLKKMLGKTGCCRSEVCSSQVLLYMFTHYYLDTDECAVGGSNTCDTNAECTNSDGSYTCAFLGV